MENSPLIRRCALIKGVIAYPVTNVNYVYVDQDGLECYDGIDQNGLKVFLHEYHDCKGVKYITEKFQNLDYDKQQRILDAAFMEFAKNGYERASTNQIVKNAAIGKGMLFYYFQSKKELYHYLVDYALQIIRYQYLNLIDMKETDFIERMSQATQVKMTCFTENPNVFNFLGTFFLESKPDIPSQLAEHYEQLLKEGNAIMYENIDKTCFRDDVDVDKVFKLIQWAMDGYQNEIISSLKDQELSSVDFTPYWEEFYAYLDILKKSFYK